MERELNRAWLLSLMGAEWWRVAAVTILSAFATFAYFSRRPETYESKALLAPTARPDSRRSALGALDVAIGIASEGPSSVQALGLLLTSNDLTARVFQKYDLWRAVYPRSYDPHTRLIGAGWIARRIFGFPATRIPNDWDAIRAVKTHLRVFPDNRLGTVEVSFTAGSPEDAATVLGYYLEEAKSKLQEEALNRATQNRRFLEQELRGTMDPLSRDRFYSIYGQEVESEMLARNREEFGFRALDSPRLPDRPLGPPLPVAVVAVTALAFVASWLVLGMNRWRNDSVRSRSRLSDQIVNASSLKR